MNTFKTNPPGAGRGWGPWWLLRSSGRYLVALLVVSAVVACVLPVHTRFGGGDELGYFDGAGSLLASTWLCFALVGWVWVLFVFLVLLPMRRRIEAPTFRGLAWYLLSLPTPLPVLVQMQPVNVLVIHVVAHAVFAVWLLPVPGPSVAANGREKEGDVQVQVVGG
ncbi:hypothetical protein [Streptomyces sp. NRRL F-5755]|uniref:hypothetical protein n=1 Tax=Streptomyces sp. NRRL F-5755 TaxID=1519475 RepID=UPI000AEF62B3|nr:hypothetical protein [Streptomyces sp. NRRL F-5755]